MIRHFVTGLALLCAASQLAFAQPPADNAPKAVNPANTNGGAQTPEEKAWARWE